MRRSSEHSSILHNRTLPKERNFMITKVFFETGAEQKNLSGNVLYSLENHLKNAEHQSLQLHRNENYLQ